MGKGLAVFLLGLLLGSGPLAAMGGDSGGGESDYDKAVALIQAEDFAGAQVLLEKVVAAEPEKADAWNYLGFVQRRQGDFEAAFVSYNQALLLDPEHAGANEYLGELYLLTGDVAQAEAQLARLEALCGTDCPEYEHLAASIAGKKQ